MPTSSMVMSRPSHERIVHAIAWYYSPFIKKMGPGSGELPYLAIFRDFIVHSAVLRTLKFEKGSKKGA